MDRVKIAHKVAYRCAYEVSGDVEKVIGEIVSQQLGVTDAPKEFFDETKRQIKTELEVDSLEEALDSEEFYEEAVQNSTEVAEEMDLI